jgi:hypothetical protein
MRTSQVFKRHKDFETLLLKKSVQHTFEAHYRLIRENKLSDHAKFMNIKNEGIVCEILNVDLPRAKKESIPEATRNGRPDID